MGREDNANSDNFMCTFEGLRKKFYRPDRRLPLLTNTITNTRLGSILSKKMDGADDKIASLKYERHDCVARQYQ